MTITRSIKKALAPVVKSLYWIPDRYFLSFIYFIKYQRKLHLRHPKRFTEWMQWYKMYERNPVMLECTDKYKVRNYVEKKGLSNILNEVYQHHSSAKEIDFSSLPDKFVIKTTDGGSGDNVYICRDKSKINTSEVIKLVSSWKNKHYERYTREWAYNGAKESNVIVEKLLEDTTNSDGSIDDYKFLCFNGKFKVLWVDKGRYSSHCRGFWDSELHFLSNVESNRKKCSTEPQLPSNIKDMIDVAEHLSKDFRFARIDLYNIEGQIIFGEITFYPWGGYVKFTPDSFDFELGSFFADSELTDENSDN